MGGLAACSTDFDPYAEGPPYFALNTDIDTREDTLFVRAQDLTVPIGAEPGPFDGRVTLEDLSTGAVVTLRDSLVVLDGGLTGHLFWTTEELRGGRTYVLAAERPDDPEARSFIPIDFPTGTVLPQPPDPDNLAAPTVAFEGQLARNTPIRFTFEARRTDTGQTTTLTVPYFPLNATEQVRVSLSATARLFWEAFGLEENDPQRLVAIVDVSVTYLTVSPAPIPTVDGRGDAVWTTPLTADWRVPAVALEAANLRDGQDG